MNATTDWKDDLIVEIVKINEEGDNKNNLKEFLQEFADKHNLAFNTVRLNYYKLKKELTYNQSSSLSEYELGDFVDVIVTGIANYGAFAVTLDENKRSGLIHVSEVKDSYIADLNQYFKIGDKVNAKIIRIDEGKFSFSVKHNDLPDYFAEENKEIDELETNNSNFTNEMNEVVQYLNNIVGIMSPKAKERLVNLIKKHGIFKFSLTAAQVAPTFENDLGLLLMNEIEKKIGDCL